MSTEVKVPVLPESVSEATIASWHKQVNEAVKRDENLVDLETDKVVLEVPSPVDGVLKEIRQRAGATVSSQEIIAIIEEGAQDQAKSDTSESGKASSTDAPQVASAAKSTSGKDKPATSVSNAATMSGTDDPTLSPAARRVATEEKIDPSRLQGSGRGGRIIKEDVLNHDATTAIPNPSPTSQNRPEERVPMTRMRTRIAQRLMQAKDSMAMLTSFNEVDLSEVMKMRKTLGASFLQEHGIKLGFMSFFVKATVEALKRYPLINASTEEGDIIYHGYQDISIAIATDRGLVTPVLRDAQNMSFADIEQGIADYANKARTNKLALEDLQGGTFTITNGGTFGSLFSTPIVNPPQSAILGMHAIKERPIVKNGQVVAAPMMYIALSYDHRIIDGKNAVLFLVDIKNQLENTQRMLLGL